MSEFYASLGDDFVCGCIDLRVPRTCSVCAGSHSHVAYCSACNGTGYQWFACDNPQHYTQQQPIAATAGVILYEQHQHHQQLLGTLEQEQHPLEHYQQDQSQSGSTKSKKKSSSSSGTHKHHGSHHGHSHRRDRDQGAGPATPRQGR